MDQDQDKVGTGDPRIDEETPAGNTLRGNPGYESEAAYRHREATDEDVREISSTQLAPGPLRETDEPSLEEPHTLPMRDDTQHRQG